MKAAKNLIKFDNLSNQVIGCAIEVHRNLGRDYWNLHMDVSCQRIIARNINFEFKSHHQWSIKVFIRLWIWAGFFNRKKLVIIFYINRALINIVEFACHPSYLFFCFLSLQPLTLKIIILSNQSCLCYLKNTCKNTWINPWGCGFLCDLFTDKRIFNDDQYRIEQAACWGNYFWTRHAAQGKDDSRELTFFEDIPVSQYYLDQLSFYDFQIRHKSRWLNAVSGFVPAAKSLRWRHCPLSGTSPCCPYQTFFWNRAG